MCRAIKADLNLHMSRGRNIQGGAEAKQPIFKLEQLERLRSEIPPPHHDVPVIHTRSQVKTIQNQCCKYYKFAKHLNFEILQQSLHATHFLKLLTNMYEYEMDPTRIVGATERTRDAGRKDGRTNGRMDAVKPIYPLTTSFCGGIKTWILR